MSNLWKFSVAIIGFGFYNIFGESDLINAGTTSTIAGLTLIGDTILSTLSSYTIGAFVGLVFLYY